MIEWLGSASLVFLLFGGLRLTAHRWLLQRFGAKSLYAMWAILPLLLLVVALPQSWWPALELKPYWFSPTVTQQPLSQWASNESSSALIAIWLTGFILILAVFIARWPRMSYGWQSGSLRVTRSAHVAGPAIVGVLRPTLTLPRDLHRRFDAEQRHFILQHERHHLQHGDTVANLLAYTLCMVFWFHPVAWLCYRRFRFDQELACDAAVLATVAAAQRIRYGQTLLGVAATSSLGGHFSPYLSRYGAKQAMKERISQLSCTQPIRYWPLFAALLLGLALVTAWQAPALAQEQSNVIPVVRVNPSYPIEAARQGTEGEVTMRFNITAEGEVEGVKVIDSQPTGVFDSAAITALQKWRYHPDAAGEGYEVTLAFRLAAD